MHAAASALPLRVRAEDLPEEFTGPLAYSDRWLWIALGLAAAAFLYYLLSWFLTRPPRTKVEPVAPAVVPDVRAEHLARIDAVVRAVAAGDATPRRGHQDLSGIVRSYVADVSSLPARTMTLADFRAQAPKALVDAIELMYPPEFAPDDDHAREQFDAAVARSRELVGRWS